MCWKWFKSIYSAKKTWCNLMFVGLCNDNFWLLSISPHCSLALGQICTRKKAWRFEFGPTCFTRHQSSGTACTSMKRGWYIEARSGIQLGPLSLTFCLEDYVSWKSCGVIRVLSRRAPLAPTLIRKLCSSRATFRSSGVWYSGMRGEEHYTTGVKFGRPWL